MSPTRRTFLTTCGGVLTALSGCLSGVADLPESGSGTVTPPPIPNSSPPVGTGGVDDLGLPDSYERIKVGSRDDISEDYQPHDLDIWHGLESEQPIYLRILDRRAGTTVHQSEYHIPAVATLDVTLLRPSKYYVQVWGPPIETPQTLLVPCTFFDCNSSTTVIKILKNGSVRSAVPSTLKNCGASSYCSDSRPQNRSNDSPV